MDVSLPTRPLTNINREVDPLVNALAEPLEEGFKVEKIVANFKFKPFTREGDKFFCYIEVDSSITTTFYVPIDFYTLKNSVYGTLKKNIQSAVKTSEEKIAKLEKPDVRLAIYDLDINYEVEYTKYEVDEDGSGTKTTRHRGISAAIKSAPMDSLTPYLCDGSEGIARLSIQE